MPEKRTFQKFEVPRKPHVNRHALLRYLAGWFCREPWSPWGPAGKSNSRCYCIPWHLIYTDTLHCSYIEPQLGGRLIVLCCSAQVFNDIRNKSHQRDLEGSKIRPLSDAKSGGQGKSFEPQMALSKLLRQTWPWLPWPDRSPCRCTQWVTLQHRACYLPGRSFLGELLLQSLNSLFHSLHYLLPSHTDLPLVLCSRSCEWRWLGNLGLVYNSFHPRNWHHLLRLLRTTPNSAQGKILLFRSLQLFWRVGTSDPPWARLF